MSSDDDRGSKRSVVVALIGAAALILGAAVGAVISGVYTYRSSVGAVQYAVSATQTAEATGHTKPTVIEVTRIVEVPGVALGDEAIEVTRVVEVTREVTVDHFIEVTRTVIETKIVEVTRIVEIESESPIQSSSATQGVDMRASESTGGAIIGVLYNDGSLGTDTRSVDLYPKTLIDATGALRADATKGIRMELDKQTMIAAVYGVEPGTYVVCYTRPSIWVSPGEIEIVAGEVLETTMRWPPGPFRIGGTSCP